MKPAALAAVGIALGVAGLVLWREARGTTAPAPFFDAVLRLDAQLATVAGARLGLSRAGLDALKAREGFSATPYRDEAGHWTVGYGHKVKPGESFTRITDTEAEHLLRADVADAEGMIGKYVTAPLGQAQHDALVSFLFNVDSDDNGAFSQSTLLRRLNAGELSAAAEELNRWVYVTREGRKVVSAGLQNRRAAESAQFLA